MYFWQRRPAGGRSALRARCRGRAASRQSAASSARPTFDQTMNLLRAPAGLLALFAFSLAASPLRAQATAVAPRATVAGDAIDGVIRAEMTRSHIPGVALAVIRGGRTIRLASYGVADLEENVPVTPRTAFKVGSLSKQFLAAGILLLQQDGKLRVDDPVAKYYPGEPEAWRPITLRHLLTHTSGILREGPAFDPFKVQPESVVIASAFGQPLLFPVGSRFEYCNVCYFTLADIIARVSGKPWDVFFTE